MGCLTVILSFFNVIFWVLGGTMLGLGIWVLVDEETFSYLRVVGGDDIYWEIALYIIMSVGGVIFLVGILGCIGACTGNKFILVFYGVFVIVAVLAEAAAITMVAIIYANMDDVGQTMQEDVKERYVSEYSTDPLSVSWNTMQMQWKCCGSYHYTDYKGSKFDESSGVRITQVPWTCCVMKYDVDFKSATVNDVKNETMCQLEALGLNSYEYLHRYGCYYDLEDVMDLAAPITLGILSGFIVIQLIGLGMSCAMSKKKQDVSPGMM